MIFKYSNKDYDPYKSEANRFYIQSANYHTFKFS